MELENRDGTVAAQENVPGEDPSTGQNEKSFTQEEVNEIVKKRLARQRERQPLPEPEQFGRQLALREQEIVKRELKIEAKERLSQQGLPAAAAELLDYGSEEAFEGSYEAMCALLGPEIQRTVQEMFRTAGRSPQRNTEVAPARQDPLKAAFSPPK